MYDEQLYNKKIVPVKNRYFFIEIWSKNIFWGREEVRQYKAHTLQCTQIGYIWYAVHTPLYGTYPSISAGEKVQLGRPGVGLILTWALNYRLL